MFISVTFVLGILSLCLKDNARTKAIDALLISATATCILMFASNYFPKDWLSSKESVKATDVVQLDFHRQADMYSVVLRKSDYCTILPEPLKTLSSFDGYQSQEAARKSAQTFLKDLVDKHPNDKALVTRLCVLTRETGADTASIFAEFHKKKGVDDELIQMLEKVYSDPVAKIDESKAQAVIEENLPEGWFRDEALKSVLSKSSPIVVQIDKSRQEAFEWWLKRYSFFQIARSLLAVLGVFAAFKFLKSRPTEDRPELINYGYRKAYGCLLTVLYSQAIVTFIIGLGIGLWIGISSTLSQKTVDVGNFASVLTTAGAAATAISTLVSVYFFVCRPAKLSLWKGFWLNSQEIDISKIVRIAFLGFCSLVTAGLLVRIVLILLPPFVNDGYKSHLQMIDAALSGNFLWVMAWTVLYCGIAPVSEEMLFRGLLYTWLKSKWGVASAVLASALIFAAFHMNLSAFPHLFVMGAVFALLYERTRSLPAVTLLHATWNMWVILTVIFEAPC